MEFLDLPGDAAWRHTYDRQGFEVATFAPREGGGFVVTGRISVVESDVIGMAYTLEIDAAGATRRAAVEGLTSSGVRSVEIVGDGAGRWTVDGAARPDLDGLLDVDLAASAFTNALPVRRLGLAVGSEAAAPAVYVNALDVTSIERLEQTYLRLPDDPPGARFGRIESRYAYAAPAFEFAAEITYDASGLVVDYPGIGDRADLGHEYPEPLDPDDLPCCAQLRNVIDGDKTALTYEPATRSVEILDRPGVAIGVQGIDFCPFCGTRLPLDLHDARYERFEALGLVDDERGLFEAFEIARRTHPEFLTSAWWRAELAADPHAFDDQAAPGGTGRRMGPG